MAKNLSVQSGFSAGSLSGQACDVLTTEDCSGSDEEEEVEVKEDLEEPDMERMPPDFSRYWKEAVKNPSDFTLWTKLVAYAEKEKNIAACRKAYDAFLACFPLAHIFWRKYIDLEKRCGNTEEAVKIYVRAVKLNPLNVTLWTSYISFLSNKVNPKLQTSAEKLKGVFNQAIEACGMEFHSDELWNLYLDHEKKLGNFKEVMLLYNRILNIPTQWYGMHFERCKYIVSYHSPVELLSKEELNMIYTKIQDENDSDPVAVEDSPSEDTADSLTEGDLQKIRQHILDKIGQMFYLNEEQVKKRSPFEDGIKRLYFFNTPLSVKQLQNWRKYLNFEATEGQHERAVVLYERCLMPCAKYEEFWLSYAQYMERYSVDAARSVFERACRIHLPLKFTLHLQWALFEEKHGQLDSSRAIMCNLENVLPGVVMVRLRRVNFERRNGNLQEAERLLQEAAQNSSSSEITTFYTVKLARLLLKLKKDPEKARNVLIHALRKEPDSPILHECLLETEISRDAVDDVMHCVERAVNSNMHDSIKRIWSQRRLQFLEDYGNSIKSLFHAYDEHQILLTEMENMKRNVNEEEVKRNKRHKKAKTPTKIEDMPIPEVSQPAIPPGSLSLSQQNVSTENASTTVPSTQETIEDVPTKPVQPQPSPVAKGQVYVPRPAARQYVHYHRPPGQHIMGPKLRDFTPPRMTPHIRTHHMGGPPGPVHSPGMIPHMHPHHIGGPPGPVPPCNLGPWGQNYGGYNGPPAGNYNRFYPNF